MPLILIMKIGVEVGGESIWKETRFLGIVQRLRNRVFVSIAKNNANPRSGFRVFGDCFDCVNLRICKLFKL